jgi:hypothetical protein
MGSSAKFGVRQRRLPFFFFGSFSGPCRGPIRFESDQRETANPEEFSRYASSLESTLVNLLVSVENKGLTGKLSLLESTLTKNRGEGGVMVNQTSDKELPAQIEIRSPQ